MKFCSGGKAKRLGPVASFATVSSSVSVCSAAIPSRLFASSAFSLPHHPCIASERTENQLDRRSAWFCLALQAWLLPSFAFSWYSQKSRSPSLAAFSHDAAALKKTGSPFSFTG